MGARDGILSTFKWLPSKPTMGERERDEEGSEMDKVLMGGKTDLQTQGIGVVGERGARVQPDQSIKIRKLAKI